MESKIMTHGGALSDIQKLLEAEADEHGGYELWYKHLEPFRNELKKYVDFIDSPNGSQRIKWKVTKVNGHYIDHHAMGYFAPLNFKRIGFGLEKRTPAEQLSCLARSLEKKDIRFIYVPLPCKKAVYPELFVDNLEVIPKDGLVIPQWRKMMHEALELGVEVVDVYHSFLRNKKEMLYSYEHHISPKGADTIALEIANYLKDTIEYDIAYRFSKEELQIAEIIPWRNNEAWFHPGEIVKIHKKDRNELYTGHNCPSEIMLIGDCNTQAFVVQGASITAKLSYYLQYPVEYGGRRLPFDRVDRINTIPKGSLANKKVLIYVGFASAPFVRAWEDYDMWSVDLIYDNAFVKE